ncbi:putative C3H1-type domain-containing protein [Seiridium cardinale]
MDRQREALITRGLTQLHTGLGILLGAGRISSATHERILALVNTDDDSAISNAGKETPVSLVSNGLEQSVGYVRNFHQNRSATKTDESNLALTDRMPRGPNKSISSISPRFTNDSEWRGSPSTTLAVRDSQPEARRSNVVCPWFLTAGYKCREQEKGMCAWVHEDIPDGVKDPLICSFWADGERCTKTKEECRFAHYWAAHREIAPQPNSKFKKPKRDVISRTTPW